jgi:DnaJ-class molecular chaperone
LGNASSIRTSPLYELISSNHLNKKHTIIMFEEAFGTADLDLYKDVLRVSKDCTPSQLRKGYYRQALKFHPDKNKSKEAKLKFQAISWAYSVSFFRETFPIF